MEWVYLDNNATTRPAAAVVAAMAEAHERFWANPSSVHRLGQMVRQRLDEARASVAGLIGAQGREMIFTSGGTEANNLALRGLLTPMPPDGPPPVLLTSGIEHSAIREPAEDLEQAGVQVRWLEVGAHGLIAPAALAAALEEVLARPRPVVVSIQWANNETGVIQPVAALAERVAAARQGLRQAGARGAGVYFHVDATQAVGKIPVDVAAAGVDLLTLAGHKFHGPKGVGALWVRRTVRLRPQQRGGPQERDRRGGTENTAGIIGLGVAAELAGAFLADEAAAAELAALRDRFEQAILAQVDDAVVHGRGVERLWNTTNIAFPGLEAEAILLSLSEQGVCASAGAACSSGSLEPSPVLLAMGVAEAVAHGSVRFSLSRQTTQAKVDAAAAVVVEAVGRLRQTLPLAPGAEQRKI